MDTGKRRSERHTKESTVLAALAAIGAVGFYFISELIGFDRTNLATTPKTLQEVIADLPKILGVGLLVFVGTWWYQMSQKEAQYKICCNCTETYEIDSKELSVCEKCGGVLEDLEGFYDRHPDKGI